METTPTQKMMYWVVKNLEKELEQNIQTDEELDRFFSENMDFERDKMREIFISGFTHGINSIITKEKIDLYEEFNNVYYKLFPEE